ncbi:MAG: nitroreductase family deazaflavin-dependent oxidoreductase [Polyangiales bacterium]
MTENAIKTRPDGLDKPYVKTIIHRMSKFNVWIYQKTGGLIGSTWRVGAAFPKGVPVLLLTTVGRKSGAERIAPLLFVRDGQNVVIVASQGGLPKNPSWFYNVKANPNVRVQIKSNVESMKARIATSEERKQLWPRLVAHYADFANYQAWTDREIPVVVLEPIRDAS